MNEELEPEQREYYQHIARVNKLNPNRYDCPTCGRKDALNAYQKQQGYQCNACADREEGIGIYE